MLKKENGLLYLAIFISIISHWFWFVQDGPYTAGDWGFVYPQTVKEFLTINSSWDSKWTMGGMIIGHGYYVLQIFHGTLGYLFDFNSSQCDLFVFFLPAILFSTTSSYFFLKYLTKSSLAGFIGSLVFSYNTYFILIQNGHPSVAVANALTPLIVLFFMKTLKERSLRNAVVTGLFVALSSQYEPRITYIICWIMILYFLYDIIVEKKIEIKKAGLAGVVCTIVILCNLYWILLLVFADSVESTSFLRRDLFGAQFFNLQFAITSFSSSWTGGKPGIFTVEAIPVRFWLIPILAFFPLVIGKVSKKIGFFYVLALVGIFLAKMSSNPFPELYRWLFYHFPGFLAFREASKFYLIINLSFAVLIGHNVNLIYELIKGHTRFAYVGRIFVFTVAGLYLFNIYPMLTQKFPLTKARPIPLEYIDVKKKLVQKDQFFRTMGVLRRPFYFFAGNIQPGLQADFIKTELWKMPELNQYDPKILKYSHMDWVFDAAGIRYVYIPSDPWNEMFDYVNEEGVAIQGFSGSKKEMEELMDDLAWLKNKKYFGEIIVYENHNYMPHLYTAQNIFFVD
ncbi:MAG: hypothetical protein ABIJ59_06645 [Pseudomonadota bacterium]